MRLLLAVLALAPSLAADQVPALDFAPPETRALIGIHLRSLIDSPVIRTLVHEFVPSGASKIPISSSLPGVNPLTDIDEVLVAATLEGPQSPSLVICRGRFPAAEFQKGGTQYHGVLLHQMPNASGLAWIDPGTIFAGDLKEIRAAIDRRNASRGRVLDPALAERAQRLSSQYAIWGAGTVPGTYHPPAGVPDALSSLDRFDFGIGLSQGLEIFAALHVRNPEDLAKLGSLLELIKAMAKPRSETNATKLETSMDNGTLTLTVLVPTEVLRQGLLAQRANLEKLLVQAASGTAGSALPMNLGAFRSPTVATPPAPPPQPKIITDENGNTVVLTLPGKR